MADFVGADGSGNASCGEGRRRREKGGKEYQKETWYPNMINKLLNPAAGDDNGFDAEMIEEKGREFAIGGGGCARFLVAAYRTFLRDAYRGCHETRQVFRE